MLEHSTSLPGARAPRPKRSRRGVRALACAAPLLWLAACQNLQPALPEARPDIPAAWPVAGAAPTEAGKAPYDIGWRDFFRDERLTRLVAQALNNNRDLRVAILNIQRARALYGVQASESRPGTTVGAGLTRSGGGTAPSVATWNATLGVAWELDIWGRVASLSEAALQQFLAQEQNAKAVQIGLVADVAGLYLTLATDRELLRISQATLANLESAARLMQRRFDLGAVSALELDQSRTLVESARADVARFTGQIGLDRNALRLLVGGDIDPANLPAGFDLAVSGAAPLPAGVPSEALLRRPDVVQAEFALRAANANIGAARAAYFPTISLTASAGTASRDLSDLFQSNTGVWSFIPTLRLPIFQGPRLDNNLAVANTDRDLALARYEKVIQTGFREVSDALVQTGALRERRQALEALLAAARRAEGVARARYEAGRDSFLTLLDAQRTLYSAQQGLVALQLAEQVNRITLYRVLGGGWREHGS